MKILIQFVMLFQFGNSYASLVCIMDSGTDITHTDLAPKVWFNPNEKVGSIDFDHDGLPGDVNGWDFTTGIAVPFNPQYNYLIDNDVKQFYLLESKYETQTINAVEFDWLKTHMQDNNFMNKADFVGDYIHGTHVAGISTIDSPNAKILAMKILPTNYHALSFLAPTLTAKSLSLKLSSELPTMPSMSIEDFTKEIVDSALPQVDRVASMNAIVKFQKVDVVNQSFGIGYKDAQGFIQTSFKETMGRNPTTVELNNIVNAYMSQLLTYGSKLFQAAPNTIFTIAAGNDNLDNDTFADYPSGIPAENKIVVAATVGYKTLAEFSNYGATKVDVAAPGVAITSTAPANNYIQLSGTSQAAPFVTNVVAQIKDLNPNISLRDVVAIVLGTVDIKPWLKNKVRSSGIVNKERAKKAALLSNKVNVTVAILKARALVPDVVENNIINKSLMEKLDHKYVPKRASLLREFVK